MKPSEYFRKMRGSTMGSPPPCQALWGPAVLVYGPQQPARTAAQPDRWQYRLDDSRRGLLAVDAQRPVAQV